MARGSVIDLVFISKGLENLYKDWEIRPDTSSGSDHEILLFSILNEDNMTNNPICQMPYNLEKADWKAFSEKLLKLENEPEFQWEYKQEPIDIKLEKEALKLQKIIQLAAKYSIPRRKQLEKSKAWWSNELKDLRKGFGRARKRFKASPTQTNIV